MLYQLANRGIAVLVLWLMLPIVGVVLFFLEPGKSPLLPGCLFRTLTGFTCPGCGTTRALHQLVHGNLSSAFQFNPLLILSLPFLLYALLRYTNAVVRGQPINRNSLPAGYIWAIFGIMLFFWIFRNTSVYPFFS